MSTSQVEKPARFQFSIRALLLLTIPMALIAFSIRYYADYHLPLHWKPYSAKSFEKLIEEREPVLVAVLPVWSAHAALLDKQLEKPRVKNFLRRQNVTLMRLDLESLQSPEFDYFRGRYMKDSGWSFKRASLVYNSPENEVRSLHDVLLNDEQDFERLRTFFR